MTPSKVFLYFCLSFIFGIFLNSFFHFSLPIFLVILIFGIFLISIFWENKKLVIIGFCFLFLVLGIWRQDLAELKITNSKLRKLNDLDQKITLIGIVSQEPDIRATNIKLTIEVQEIKKDENCSRPVGEKVLVTTNRYPQYQYGDKLKITGKLKAPQELGDFDYPGYLAKEGIYSVIYWPKIELIGRENYRGLTSLIYAKILSLKNKLRESIYQNLSPPQSSILGAIILGDKRQISEEWKEKLNITGLRHITAISGMHVTILAGILVFLGIAFGLWRGQVFYFALILIALFIVMTGLQPSAIRAGIMAGLFLLAQYLGRLSVSSRAIVFAATIMLLQNPLLLRLDVGFQLSFLAMMGIIYLGPLFQNWLRKIPNLFQLRNILAMTLSAQVFTLPILVYNFSYVSLIAPLTNLLVVPLLPFLMITGFIFGIAGIFIQSLGQILSWPAWLLLTYLTTIVDWFSGFPLAAYTLEISWVWLIISYLILGLITWQLKEKQKLRFLQS